MSVIYVGVMLFRDCWDLCLLITGNCVIVYWQSRQWDGPMLCPMCRRQVYIVSICTPFLENLTTNQSVHIIVLYLL